MIADIFNKHRRQIMASPGVDIAARTYALATLDDIESDLRACHRSRTPSPEEVEAVARAMWIDSENTLKAEHRIKWDDAGETFRAEHLSLARAALAASDAYRVQELERMTTA